MVILGDIDTEECIIWSLVIDQLKSEKSFNITGCKHNDQCTGFTCNGSVELYVSTEAFFFTFMLHTAGNLGGGKIEDLILNCLCQRWMQFTKPACTIKYVISRVSCITC
jgi:hypothetical protein